MRAFLRQQGYRNACVRLDTSDWRLNATLAGLLSKNPEADIEPIRLAYLAQRLQGRDIPQVLLLHHNLINALWLDDVIRQFRDMGWTITTPAQAYTDPVYQLMPDRPVAGRSLLLSMGRCLGLSTEELGLRLMDDGDFEIEALRQQGC